MKMQEKDQARKFYETDSVSMLLEEIWTLASNLQCNSTPLKLRKLLDLVKTYREYTSTSLPQRGGPSSRERQTCNDQLSTPIDTERLNLYVAIDLLIENLSDSVSSTTPILQAEGELSNSSSSEPVHTDHPDFDRVIKLLTAKLNEVEIESTNDEDEDSSIHDINRSDSLLDNLLDSDDCWSDFTIDLDKVSPMKTEYDILTSVLRDL